MLIRFFFFNSKIVEMMKIFLLIAALVAYVSAQNSNCGGNCGTRGGCPSCPCGTQRSKQDITTWCKKGQELTTEKGKGGWSMGCCECIMRAESGGNANAVGYNKATKTKKETYDAGLWQINSENWACSGGKAPCDPQANLKCAVQLWKENRTWGGKLGNLWATAKDCNCLTKA